METVKFSSAGSSSVGGGTGLTGGMGWSFLGAALVGMYAGEACAGVLLALELLGLSPVS